MKLTRLTIKLLAVVILVVLASPVFVLNGCGKPLNGGQCGSCPDSTAPFGSKITASDISSFAPSTTESVCWPSLTFIVVGPDSQPMSDVCVEIYTDGASMIARHTSGQPNCSEVIASPKTSMVTRTNSSGVVELAYWVPTALSGDTFFVQASSCSITAIAKTAAAQ